MEAWKTAWDFFQNEVLGMKWLYRLIGSAVEACGLDPASKVGGSIQFFLYDIIKIMVLLGVLILIISYIQSYFPPERTKKILGRFHGIGANCIAALLGTVTPFCSCSSIPLFIGFTSAGLPLGVTFSFLISSPMVDLGSLVLLMSIFGWKVAVVNVVLGLVIAVAGGTLIERLNCNQSTGKYLRCYQIEDDACKHCSERSSCFDKAGIRRRVLASGCYPAFYRGHQRVGTPEFLSMMRLRKIWAEGSFSVLKREHCISKIRKRGILAATEECLLAAMALNLKRMASAVFFHLHIYYSAGTTAGSGSFLHLSTGPELCANWFAGTGEFSQPAAMMS